MIPPHQVTERYIKRMMRRGRTLITPADAEQAFEFAVYDSKVRKKELYERRLRVRAQDRGRPALKAVTSTGSSRDRSGLDLAH